MNTINLVRDKLSFSPSALLCAFSTLALWMPACFAADPGAGPSHHEENHKAGLGAHVHGNAKLTLALETDKEGTLLLESPGDSIMGFEHAATKPADIKARDEAIGTLKTKGDELFTFAKSSDCEVVQRRVEILKEEHHDDDVHEGKEHGEHSEVEAEYQISCRNGVNGTDLVVALGRKFPRIKKLDVQVLTKKGQTATKLGGAVGTIKI